ncbi:MAG: O-antigen ligase family protein [Comamonas sp.]
MVLTKNNTKRVKNIFFVSANIAAFLFFAFFLSLRSMHSVAMALTLCISIASFYLWRKTSPARNVRILALFFLFLAIFWSNSFDGWMAWSTEGDYFIKYSLGAVCMLAVCALGIHPRVLAYAVAVGCISSGVLALVEFPVSGRAAGFTNAIRFGNIAVILSIASWLLASANVFLKPERLFFLFAGCMGVVASLLSLSRGGWIFLLTIPFLFLFFTEEIKIKIKIMFALGVVAGILGLVILQIPATQDRILLAEKEVAGYFSNKDAYVGTSVGVRLEQWKMGLRLGAEKPLTGWGDKGIQEGKKWLVEQGYIDPSALSIPHTHNDLIEMWAARGIIGVLFILSIYIIPAYLFFPSRKIISEVDEKNKSLYIALHLIGFIIPTGYFVFGWTDVFFNLSIGHNFYIFSMIFILATIQWVKNSQTLVPRHE